MRKTGLATAVIGAGILASGAAAHAQFFNLSTTFSSTQANGSTVTANNPNYFLTSANESVTGNDAIGGSTIHLLDILSKETLSSSINGTYNTIYTVTYTITSTATAGGAQIGSLGIASFTGLFSGTVSNGGTTLSFTPTNGAILTPVTAGGSNFFLTVNGNTPPGAPTVPGSPGNVSAFISETSNVPVGVPEPGAVAMLFGMGLSGGVFAYRRRRSRA
jgi:hypothetical protein